MASEIVGTRRLYRALGITMEDPAPLQMEFNIGDAGQSAWVYLGPRPRFNVVYTTSNRYVVPGELSATRIESQSDPSKTPYAGSLFAELAVFQRVEVTDELSIRFHQKDVPARQEILSLAEVMRPQHVRVLDLLAGMIGLRFHRQLVLAQLHQEVVGLRESDWVHGLASPWVEILDAGDLTPRGASVLAVSLQQVGQASIPDRERAGDILFWLLSAWASRDAHSKFLMLFTPLEMILEGVGGGMPEEQSSLVNRIRELVTMHGAEQAPALTACLESLVKHWHLSIVDRFAALAEGFDGPRWRQDVEAFRQFNGIRNGLLHRGKREVGLTVNIGDQEVQPLEDLVERYVCKALFGDWAVYQSRWRRNAAPSVSSAASPDGNGREDGDDQAR